jgi:hypothetical protein
MHPRVATRPTRFTAGGVRCAVGLNRQIHGSQCADRDEHDPDQSQPAPLAGAPFASAQSAGALATMNAPQATNARERVVDGASRVVAAGVVREASFLVDAARATTSTYAGAIRLCPSAF